MKLENCCNSAVTTHFASWTSSSNTRDLRKYTSYRVSLDQGSTIDFYIL